MSAWIEGAPPHLEAGMQIDIAGEGICLVGDINEDGGSCSCCSRTEHETITRYRWLLTPEQMA